MITTLHDLQLHIRDKTQTEFKKRDNRASQVTSEFSWDRLPKIETVPAKQLRTVTLQ